ncbi:HVO_0234 family beta-propeller protein [Halopiger thermotolerans]
MDSIEEKRVYGDREGALEAYVTSSMGVVRVRVAGDAVGEFSLCERCDARDVATTRDGVAVAIATDEDVRVFSRAAEDGGNDDPAFEETGFGEAVAVGYDGAELVAAGPAGEVACWRPDPDPDPDPDGKGGEWETLEDETVAAVRAIDGDLIGTESGVYRVHDGGLDHVGLSDVRDVSAAGVPLAATAEGLYKLGNGWMELADGAFDAVAADPHTEPGRLTRAIAASAAGTVYALADGEWTEREGPAESIVAVGYGDADAVYAVTEGGSFLALETGESADGDGGPPTWRPHPIGVTDVTGLAVGAPVRE